MDLTATHRTTHQAGPTARRDHHSRQWLVLVGVLALLLAAGTHAAPQPMYFNHIGMLQGLSQNTVMAVRQVLAMRSTLVPRERVPWRVDGEEVP